MKEQTNLSSTTFYCFTPIVSLSTFFIEIFLALYVLCRYKLSQFSLLSILILILLGLFQLTEYLICTYPASAMVWAKIGSACITLLPALALHLVCLVTKKSYIKLTYLNYFTALAFISVLFWHPVIPLNINCTGQYVALNLDQPYNILYSTYYFGFVLAGLFILLWSIKLHQSDKKELFWLITAYLSFIIPTLAIYIFIATAREGVASIMCGFAVITAFILTFIEIPRYQHLLKSDKNI